MYIKVGTERNGNSFKKPWVLASWSALFVISSASVRLALDFCSLRTWLGIQVLLGCQEHLACQSSPEARDASTWCQARCLRKLLPISQKAAQLWVLTGCSLKGVRNGKLCPTGASRVILPRAPAAPPFHSAFWPSDCWGQVGNKTGRWSEEERAGGSLMGNGLTFIWDPTQTCQVGGQDRCPFTLLGCRVRVWEEESLAIQIKACFSMESLLSEDWGLCSSLSPALSLSWDHGDCTKERGSRACSINYLTKNQGEGLPGGLVVKTSTFQCRGFSLVPGWGAKILHTCRQNLKIKQKHK